MNRQLLLLIALTATLAGCKKAGQKPADQKAADKANTPAAVAEEPANDDPPGMKMWTDEQLEQQVREDMKFTSLTLKKESRDKFTGTGTTAVGKAYKLVVRARPGEYRIDAEAAVQPPGGNDKKSSHWCAETVTPKWKDGAK
ncbi:hypothetical protein [Limnoglobus roseus]|uniref:Lipoprotein n=1 Tax=Limnoglobus roseus TaxID=2598579 RepID=A0A5C1ADP4_9BACT|nr:hypothetical protein [Limnoglobus roseus]QEL16765.1 hypothetical protein PX52LOC_03734 [Limnoglobus roseus]